MLWFCVIAALYILCLALVDGLFNRLVFREKRKLAYVAPAKQKIYQHWEWQYIGLLLLIILPVVFPVIVAFSLGGMQYVWIYLALLMLLQWDVLFGKLVFDDWWGDTPSIALPGIGWMHHELKSVILARLSLAALFGVLALPY